MKKLPVWGLLSSLAFLSFWFLCQKSEKFPELEKVKIYSMDGYKVPTFASNDRRYTNHWENRPSSEVKHLVIHITTCDLKDTLETFTDKRDLQKDGWTSAHYVLTEDEIKKIKGGEIICVVPESKLARHAGVSYWRGEEKLNKRSVGIELVNTSMPDEFASGAQQKIQWKPLDQKQMDSLGKLCQHIIKRYSIKPHNIIGHSDIAYARPNGQGKIDPGPLFPWGKMYTKYGIGMWLTQKELKEAKKHIGSQFDMALFLQCLQKIGYKTPLNAKEVEKLVYVFQCHFSQNQNSEKCTGIPTAEDFLWAYGLSQKYQKG